MNEIEDPLFLKNVLAFGNCPVLDLEKLTVAGHSFGGGTAIRTAWNDKRVKCVLTHDPWLSPLRDEIFDPRGFRKKFSDDQSLLILNSEAFIGFFKDIYDLKASTNKVTARCKKLDEITLLDADHVHQADAICYWGEILEAPRFASGYLPRSNCHLIL
jgi:pimeloyl-ACP methyl ester carboxylesterase